MTIPSRGRLWKTVRGTSPVPGGISTNILTLKDYKPLTKDHYFYFVDGKIILADKNNVVVFPEGSTAEGQWMSLSGEVPMDANYTVENGETTITSGAQLVHLMDTVANGGLAAENALTVKLDGNIDLKGSAVNFGKVTKNITIDGSNATLSGLRADSNAFVSTHEGADKAYGFSLFGSIDSGKTVVVKDLNLSNVVIEDTADGQSGMAGLIAGGVYGNLEVTNVTIDNCTVAGADKVGSIVGYVSGSVKLNNVKVTNTKVSGAAFVAKAIGYKTNAGTVVIENSTFDVEVSIIILPVVDDTSKMLDVDVAELYIFENSLSPLPP